MSSSSSHSITIALIVALALASAARVAAEDLPALLARPMTPGSVALLVDHVMEPAAQKPLIEAVKHADPAVRAVAARIAFVTTSKGLAPPLITAIAKEEHIPTAAEQIRALMHLLGEPGDNLVMRQVERIGGPAAVAVAESLARSRPAALPTHLPALIAAVGAPETLGAPIAAAVGQHPSLGNEILQAVLAAKNEKLWEALLSSARNNTVGAMPSAALVQALQSTEEYQRTAAVWHVFYTLDDGQPVPDDVIAAAAPKPAAAGAAAAGLTWEDFGREMLARARQSSPVKADWAGLIALDRNQQRVKRLGDEAFSYLTPDELKAVSGVRGFGTQDEQKQFVRGMKSAAAADPARVQVMRTIPVFAKGLLGDLLQVTGCRPPNERHFAIGDVTYHPQGGPKSISVVQMSMSKDCEKFVYTMMKLTIALAERPVTRDFADRIVLLFNRQYLACADDPFPPVRPRARPDSTITPPTQKRQARFEYPAAAERHSMRGIVRLGVRISHTGCIGSAETLRSINPVLDLSAIRGVFTAEYTPGLVDGRPVEVYMTYTVNFAP